MRLSPYTASLIQTTAARRPADWPIDPVAALPPHYPQQQPTAWPAVERVFEGEVLPRPAAAESLLTDYRASVLTAQAQRVVPQSSPAPVAGLTPSQVLFYQLHSSNETLSGDDLGRHVNQFV
jgi:hypothetical protein